MTCLVHIHQRRFAVEDDAIGDLQEALLEAIHAGGGFVPISNTMTVLVTQFTPVVIEKLPPQPEDDAADFPAQDFAYFDVDEDL